MESDSKEFEARKWTAFETKFPSWKKKKIIQATIWVFCFFPWGKTESEEYGV